MLPLLWPVGQSGAAVEHNDGIVTLGLLSKQHVMHTPLWVNLTMVSSKMQQLILAVMHNSWFIIFHFHMRPDLGFFCLLDE